VIILDTHVWVWWVHADDRLTPAQARLIEANESGRIGVSAITCWEVAKLVERRRLVLPTRLEEWFELALSYPGVSLVELTPAIVVESTRLPGEFHRDPADQIIVATARVHDCPLVTSDRRILQYPHITAIA